MLPNALEEIKSLPGGNVAQAYIGRLTETASFELRLNLSSGASYRLNWSGRTGSSFIKQYAAQSNNGLATPIGNLLNDTVRVDGWSKGGDPLIQNDQFFAQPNIGLRGAAEVFSRMKRPPLSERFNYHKNHTPQKDA